MRHSTLGDPAYDARPDFGLLYDAMPAYEARPDVPFYVRAAREAAGPVLELGCGTGRILLPMARAGATVVGIDGSRAMLARCRERLAAEPADVAARVRIEHADARDFALDATFALVVAPFRILQHVVTIEEQLRCIDCVARHLAPGGRFVFDVFNPSMTILASDRSEEREDTPEQRLPDGRTVRRAVRIPRVRWTEQVSDTELVYYVAERPGATPERHVQAFPMRWYLRAELVHLLARGGLRVDAVYGGFDESPLVDGAMEQVVVATRV
jgi:SAM-dependent methyltransferase